MENQKTTIPNWFWAEAVFSLLGILVASFFNKLL
jgi:hypothetical protein